MADNKLSAGRRMLMEFQKKKTEKKNSHVNENANFNSEMENHPADKNTNGVDHVKPELTQSRGQPPDVFFDEFSGTTINQNSANNVNQDVPLAGVLFTTQSHNDVFTPPAGSAQNTNALDSTQHAFVTQNINEDEDVSGSPEVHDIKTLVEFSKLQQQLQFHIKTVEFLVTEKNNLVEKLQENEKVVEGLNAQLTDLSGRLNISRHRVSHLESEYSQLKQKNEVAELQLSKLTNDSHSYQTVENTYKKQLLDVQEELQEMKTMMDDKMNDYKVLLKKFEEVSAQLQSNELRLQQLAQGDTNATQHTALQEHCFNLEQMVNQLRQQLSQSESEKNHSSLHYQQYVQQLNTQVQNLNEKHEELIHENERLQSREESLLNQMSTLEKQMQSNMNLAPSSPQADTNKDAVDEKLQALEAQLSQLNVELQKKETLLTIAVQLNEKKENYIMELADNLQKIQSESPDIAKLNAAIESDRLAAQKATAQNTKMKDDLHHLEKAFEQMTKSKLELAELLQAEKTLAKNLTLKLVETEEKLKETDSKLMAKDEEMIRLQSNSSELEKKLSKHVHTAEDDNCCETQEKSLDEGQSELLIAKLTIEKLTNENETLRHKCSESRVANGSETEAACEAVENPTGDETKQGSVELTKHIPTTEAMTKLQEKFTKLMEEVADLSDEKQKLEHIVLQLQGETETICEYIALYQKQRSILKQREAERSAQLVTLSQERQNMKKQLDDLKQLVFQLQNNESNSTNADNKPSVVITKIVDLVTEIKSNHLVEPTNDLTDLRNFNHCPCCSGQLITV